MLTRTFGSSILSVLSLALLPACVAHVEEAGEWLSIGVQASSHATKTTMTDDGSDTEFHFSTGDDMGFFANGVLNNKLLSCTDGGSGSFSGRIFVQGAQAIARPSVDYYAYYPYSKTAGGDPLALTATLPSTQRAPFDGQADFLVADPVTDKYDVDDFPALNFEFNTHLFAVVKLSITNTNDAYAGEELLSIGLKSTDTPLAGQFTFSAVDGDVEFSDDPNYLSNQVLVEYATPPTLGTGVTHSVYAVVNAASYASGSLSLVVNTTNNIFTVSSQKVLSPKTYQMTALGTVDIASASRRKRVRTIVLWGDSITGPGLYNAVRAQLGPNWNVIRAGVSGDSANGIAARQGGLAMVTQGSSFMLPASSAEYVNVDGLYWRDGEEGSYSYGKATGKWHFIDPAQLNPLLIKGIECEISWDSENNRHKLRRLSDGDAVEIPARTEVVTWGARAYADADVIQVYMGTNGRPSDEKLIELHDKMKTHLSNPEALMFVLGFHQSPTDFPQYWKQTYVDAMTTHYGGYFIDQRTLGGGVNAVPLMLEIGQITDPSQVSATDQTYIDRGDWPLSWSRGPGDVHPTYTEGNVVQAILLRRRMAELGLL